MNVWESGIDDGAFWVQVVRDEPYKGILEIYRGPDDTGEKIHSEPVNIAYDAPFGPDSFDVNEWADKAIQVVDSQ